MNIYRMATYRPPKLILPFFNPLVYPVGESVSIPPPILVGYTFTALYDYPQPNPNTDLVAEKWQNITSSADCSVLYVPEGNMYTTTNGYVYVTESGSPPTSGFGFVSRGVNSNYIGIACSDDGTRAVTSTDDSFSTEYSRLIFWTSNSGVTWNSVNLSSIRFTNFACSSSGLIMYGAGRFDTFIYKSTDGGSSWTSLTNSGSRRWGGVACVPEGDIVYGCVGNNVDGETAGYIYKSTNSGSNWTQLSAPINIYGSISCDYTGQIVIASTLSGSVNGKVLVSTNGGSNWTTTSLTGGDFFAVKCSLNGTKLFACSAGALFYSLDLGVTWTDTGINRTFTGVTCNTDGTIVYAVENSNPSTTGGNVFRGVPVYP